MPFEGIRVVQVPEDDHLDGLVVLILLFSEMRESEIRIEGVAEEF